VSHQYRRSTQHGSAIESEAALRSLITIDRHTVQRCSDTDSGSKLSNTVTLAASLSAVGFAWETGSADAIAAALLDFASSGMHCVRMGGSWTRLNLSCRTVIRKLV